MIEDLNEFLNRDPFVPFRIVLTSGSNYVVFSPYQLTIEASRMRYYYRATDGLAILRLNQLAAIETMVEPLEKTV